MNKSLERKGKARFIKNLLEILNRHLHQVITVEDTSRNLNKYNNQFQFKLNKSLNHQIMIQMLKQ